ncbi:synaptogyrin-1 [Trichechus manatus latirostris]|uniref:Synaptogyrin-1 n=1 Tax=Trichechus manatus latirostris TaxID=127582 RepID=A0A2Y9QMH1_TRIMA|nr:synaptogyrin-1 [Trichechus manatus latirostris]
MPPGWGRMKIHVLLPELRAATAEEAAYWPSVCMLGLCILWGSSLQAGLALLSTAQWAYRSLADFHHEKSKAVKLLLRAVLQQVVVSLLACCLDRLQVAMGQVARAMQCSGLQPLEWTTSEDLNAVTAVLPATAVPFSRCFHGPEPAPKSRLSPACISLCLVVGDEEASEAKGGCGFGATGMPISTRFQSGLVLAGGWDRAGPCLDLTPASTSQVFSIVVFGSIVNEGYLNSPDEAEEGKEFCIYNRNPNACSYGVTVGVLAFLTCLLYLALDVYFPQISSVKDRKKAVLSDIGVSAFWAFLWFVGFCFLANQWQVSKPKDNPLNEGTDAARAAITFSFFSIFTWVGQAVLAFQRYQIGADSALFSQDYMDPSQDSSMPYAPYVEPSAGPDPAGMGGTYQQPANAFDTEPQGYQSQGY